MSKWVPSSRGLGLARHGQVTGSGDRNFILDELKFGIEETQSQMLYMLPSLLVSECPSNTPDSLPFVHFVNRVTRSGYVPSLTIMRGKNSSLYYQQLSHKRPLNLLSLSHPNSELRSRKINSLKPFEVERLRQRSKFFTLIVMDRVP